MQFSGISRDAAARLRRRVSKWVGKAQPLLVRGLEGCVVALLRACPPAKRFNLARRLAQWQQPYRRWLWRRRKRWGRPLPISPNAEEALGSVLRLLTQNALPFTPPLRTGGAQALGETGVLIVMMHFDLNFLPILLLAQETRPWSNVSAVAPPGQKRPRALSPRSIPGDAMAFVRARQRIRAGEIVSFAIDRRRPFAGSHAFETAVGTHYIAENVIKSAALARLRVAYLETDLRPDGEIEARFHRITATDADEMLQQIIALARAKIARSPFQI